jgi:hypothetical protein
MPSAPPATAEGGKGVLALSLVFARTTAAPLLALRARHLREGATTPLSLEIIHSEVMRVYQRYIATIRPTVTPI